MTGPMPRNENDLCIRKDDFVHSGSARRRDEPRETPYFLRVSQPEFVRLEEILRRLRHRSRADLIIEAILVLLRIEELAGELNYRHRDDAMADMIACFRFVLKRGPLPPCAKLEEPIALSSDQDRDQGKLL